MQINHDVRERERDMLIFRKIQGCWFVRVVIYGRLLSDHEIEMGGEWHWSHQRIAT